MLILIAMNLDHTIAVVKGKVETVLVNHWKLIPTRKKTTNMAMKRR